jgi:hypothetical protein
VTVPTGSGGSPARSPVTDEQLTRAAGPENSDAAVAVQMIARETRAAEVYGDSAYGTGGLRAALTKAGHQVIIKPGPLKPAVEGRFTLDDFTVDESAGTRLSLPSVASCGRLMVD